MTKDIYLALKKRLNDVVLDVDVDYYTRQYMTEGADDSVYDLPVIYLEFEPIVWQSYPDGAQLADLRFVVHAVSESTYDGELRILDDTINAHLELAQAVYKALHNFECLYSFLPKYSNLQGTVSDRQLMNNITRTSQDSDHNLSPYLVSRQRFETVIWDRTAGTNKIAMQASVNLQIDAVIKVP